jgi:hypothetical protein
MTKTMKRPTRPVKNVFRTEEEILKDIGDFLFAKDSGGMADTLSEVFNKPVTDFSSDVCRKYFDTVDRKLKIMAFMWGLDDTEVRDDIYEHFKRHGLPQV